MRSKIWLIRIKGVILSLKRTDLIRTGAQSQEIKSEVTWSLILLLHIITNELHMIVMPIYKSTLLCLKNYIVWEWSIQLKLSDLLIIITWLTCYHNGCCYISPRIYSIDPSLLSIARIFFWKYDNDHWGDAKPWLYYRIFT